MKTRFLSKIFSHGLKALLNQDHIPNFRSIAYCSKKIEPPKAYFIHCIKLAFPGTPIVQPLFLNPQSLVNIANFALGCIALSYFY
jgi:hypothetical protein